MANLNKEQKIESLTRNQKETIGILSVGTFLEYFDLMLYVHMSVLLNELFFAPRDPHGAAILAAFAFCSTYLLRPIGALLFGWIGDKMGRKTTVIITTFLMSISCIAMANLPTYEQIGITAGWIVTICRILQGMSSMGEITGAQLYISETIPLPYKYPAVAFLAVAVSIGTMAALGVAFFVTNYEFNWRYAFWAGALIAIIGATARTRLRETPDFADVKRFLERGFQEENIHKNPAYKKFFDIRAPKKTYISLLCMDCMWPVCFYFVYVHCGLVLKTNFGFTADQVIQQNLTVSFLQIGCAIVFAYLCTKMHPLKILKYQYLISIPLVMLYPYLLNHLTSPMQLLFIQTTFVFFAADAAGATSVFFRHFPILTRFTSLGLMYAISRTIIYLCTSFGFVYLIDWFGNWGMLIIMLPVYVGYAFGWLHFNKLEIEKDAIIPKYTIVEEHGEIKVTRDDKKKGNDNRKNNLKRSKERSKKILQKFVPKESTI